MFYTLKHAAERSGLSRDTLKGYCRDGLMDPVRDSTGRRLFTAFDLKRAREIHTQNQVGWRE